MIAPVAFQDKLYPEQKLLHSWNEELALKWLDRWNTYFHPDNGVSYGSPVSIGPDYGGSVAKYSGGAIAPNGIMYVLGHLADDFVEIDTFTDTFVSSSAITNPSALNAIYHPYTNCIYYGLLNQVLKVDLATNAKTYISTVSG